MSGEVAAQASERARTAGAWALAGLASLRMCVAFTPMPWFDSDPALDPSVFGGIGPATSLLLDGLTASLAMLLLALDAWEGRMQPFVRLGCWLLLPGMVVLAWWGTRDMDHLWRGAPWISGTLAALALCSACAGSRVRVAGALGLLMAGIALLAVRGATQLLREHPDTVAYYEETRSTFLAARGWEEGSPQALAYERRLMQPEATGWFGLSNVSSSVLAAGAIVAGVLAVGGRGEARARVILGATAVAALALVGLNGSKGALAALLAGVLLLAVLQLRPRAAVPVALGVIVLAWVAVVARGMLGPDLLGERSLLFRWHYAQGALAALLESPFMGVGPEGFQDSFIRLRPPLSPEEVQSAHAVFLDWVLALGIAGTTLCGVLLGMVFAAVRGAGEESSPQGTGELKRGEWLAILLGTLVVGVMSMAAESETLDGTVLPWRLAGMAFAPIVALAVMRVARERAHACAIALACSALVLVLHAQVELTMFVPTAAPWILCLIGLAAAPAGGRTAMGAQPHPAAGLVALPPAAWAVYLLLFAYPSLAWQEEAVEVQAMALAGASDAEALREAREHAAGALAGLSVGPPRARLALAAARQFHIAALLTRGAPPANALFGRAAETAASCGPPVESVARYEAAAAIASMVARGGAAPSDAVDAWERVLAADPRHVAAWVHCARAREFAGDRAGAIAAYQAALDADDSFRLDPLRQMPATVRAAVEAELARLQKP